MRVIGLDVGEKRIGVARGDTDTRIAVPLGFLMADDSEWEKLAQIITLNNISTVVVGLPRSNEGNETAQSNYARDYAKVLEEKFPGVEIVLQDETLTSVVAEERLQARKKPYDKGEIDAEAATIILQDYLERYVTNSPIKPIKEGENGKKKSKKTLMVVVFSLVAAVLVFIIGCGIWFKASLGPVVGNCAESGCEEVPITITEGESKSYIAAKLEASGVIKSALAFKIYYALFASESPFKSGGYVFNKGQSVDEIITILGKGPNADAVFDFTIRPGETIYDIKANLVQFGYSTAEINEAFNASYDFAFLSNRPEGATLEGYLFGETHEFYKNTPVREIIETFLKGMDKVIKENDLEAKYRERGLSLFEGITLASVVQKEAKSEDQPTVAQVFLTRLNYGMHLGSDVTVAYALDTVDPNRQIYSDNTAALTVDSCYNTRLYVGLPCGPISNPGLSALLAVASPSDTAYLFFLTGDDGLMYYSYTEEEHNQNIYSHCQNLCNVSL